MYKISVIIPVYGVEKYIERCARSLFEQTLDSLEFIFIDDCTQDNSLVVLGRIIEEYRPRFAGNNWKVRIEKMPTNSGLPAVRRHGVNCATGDYIVHCDSDDWVDKDMYKQMYSKAQTTNADIVICDYYCSDGIKKKSYISAYSEEKEVLINQLLFENGNWAIWDVLVKRELYFEDGIVFPKDNMGEDFALLIQLLYRSKRISHLQSPLYYYYNNVASITHQNSKEKIISLFCQACNNIEIVQSTLLNKTHNLYYDGVINVMSLQRNILSPFIREKGVFTIWKKRFPGLTKKVLCSSKISIKHKLRVVLNYIVGFLASIRK